MEKEKLRVEKILNESDSKQMKEKSLLQEENEHHQVPAPIQHSNIYQKPNQEKSFNQQQVVSGDLYKIPITVKNLTSFEPKGISSPSSNSVRLTTSISSSKSSANNNQAVKAKEANGIINSVENFQMIPKPIADSNNVLQQPMMLKTSSTTTTTMPASKTNSKSNQVVPLVPAMTPNSKNATKPSTKASVEKSKKNIPNGIVWPVPDTDLMDREYPDNDLKDNQDLLKNELKDDKKFDDSLKIPQNNPNDINELENGAHEINDNNENDFNIDKDHDHIHDILDSDKNLNNNNAAEHEDDNYDLGQQKVLGGKKKNDKLMNEIAGDHGKEGGYLEEMEDIHMDNHMEAEEEGDGK